MISLNNNLSDQLFSHENLVETKIYYGKYMLFINY